MHSPAPANPIPQAIPPAPLAEAAIALTRVPPARLAPRHSGVLLGLGLCVLAPVALTGSYLWLLAADQYASPLGFTITTADAPAGDTAGAFGTIGLALGLQNTGNRDSEVLYHFLRSPALVTALDEQLNLRAMFAAPHDPVFAFAPSGTAEDLTRYWSRMVRPTIDPASGIITLRVTAFSPADAQRLAVAIADESTRMINALTAAARAEATRATAAELAAAADDVAHARAAMTAFRISHQMIDTAADAQGRIGLQNALQAQLASALIDLDLLQAAGHDTADIRLRQAQQRVTAITHRLDQMQADFGTGSDYATAMADYERLTVERDFAEAAHLAAMAAHTAAKAEADRQSRFLAVFDPPRTPELAEYPRRWLILGLTTVFSALIWAIGTLSYYALRDRR
ncbi:polysaccharide export-assoiated protein [Ketogulonicigenium robustum]|uniref:Polysaccharide export-assoiated protein n=1 Tax=Ketogulonicigenium robustum TaxID=92947 RepID=A0A1W6P1U0_9RHOB|nr:hypothetical protein [Ketogulonicigenium robustum]ARO15482.1 polysaccharide export-assoiated protein [Ketogulonicigenium robustum]